MCGDAHFLLESLLYTLSLADAGVSGGGVPGVTGGRCRGCSPRSLEPMPPALRRQFLGGYTAAVGLRRRPEREGETDSTVKIHVDSFFVPNGFGHGGVLSFARERSHFYCLLGDTRKAIRRKIAEQQEIS